MQLRIFAAVAVALILFGCLASPQQATPSAEATATPVVTATPTPTPELEEQAKKELAAEESEDTAIKMNSEVYAAMVEAGIPDALVDISEDRIVIGFVLPADIPKENALGYVAGLAGEALPESKTVVVQLFGDDGKALEQYETTPAKIKAAAESGDAAKLLSESKVKIG
ncbi:hypothetical protein HZC09_05245 [Candidatus Micrarchaeota archaeon]|nr:hypothetical protein [Candidatus Micrarchaeota archaeon]